MNEQEPDITGAQGEAGAARETAGRGEAGEWSVPAAQEIPRATYVPAMLAMGVTLMLWGIAAAWPLSAAGLVLTVLSLGGWIGELLHGE